jgi:Uma2 family endonuclease
MEEQFMPATLAPPPESEHLEREPDFLYEVIDGRIVEKPVGAREVMLANTLSRLLSAWLWDNDIGHGLVEMGYPIPPKNNERKPDFSIVSFESWPHDRELPVGGTMPVIPELAVEVISPSNYHDDIDEKIEEYFGAGVKEVWVVSTRHRRITQYTSVNDVFRYGTSDMLTSDLLPGYELPVQQLFPAKRTK